MSGEWSLSDRDRDGRSRAIFPLLLTSLTSTNLRMRISVRVAMDAKRLKVMYKYCPHCQKQCSIKAYKDHKRLFFNLEANLWVTVASLSATHEAESDSTSLSSEDDINIEHTFSFEPTASESGGTNVAYTRDIANDAVETDSPSANGKGKNHITCKLCQVYFR